MRNTSDQSRTRNATKTKAKLAFMLASDRSRTSTLLMVAVSEPVGVVRYCSCCDAHGYRCAVWAVGRMGVGGISWQRPFYSMYDRAEANICKDKRPAECQVQKLFNADVHCWYNQPYLSIIRNFRIGMKYLVQCVHGRYEYKPDNFPGKFWNNGKLR